MILQPGEAVKHSSKTTYKKTEGTLYFTNKRLAWCKLEEQTPTVEILHEHVHTPKVSTSAAKIMLKVVSSTPESNGEPVEANAPVFVWKQTDKEAANAERTKFVTELSLLSTRRVQAASTQPAGARPTPQGASTADTEYGKVKIGAVPASADEIKLRQEVLAKNRDLAKVHKTLVIPGLVPEDEFWSTRRNILETYAIQSQLRKGEASSWLYLSHSIQESGNFKYTITPNVARRIFKEYPQVKRAYVENVPHAVGEKEFWKRFVASQFFNRGRTTDAYKGRDKIFDKCVDEEDAVFRDTGRFDVAFLTRLLDLTRTEEDSVETGNAPDFTMRPSTVDKKLPLIRRFNQHSQLVLQTVLNNKRKLQEHDVVDKTLEEATLLRDLDVAVPEKKVRLNIHDRTQYFASVSKSVPNTGRPLDPNERRVALEIGFDISRPLDGCGNTQRTMQSLSQATHRRALQHRPNRIQELDIPDDINGAVAECHGAGTEMLRHLWALLKLPQTQARKEKADKIVKAFDGVVRHIRETVAKAKSMEAKHLDLGSMVESMLQPTMDSLRAGKVSFEAKMKNVQVA
ncbi:RNA polymerase II transcription factor B subunit 1 [Coemansia sp. RSA 1807]|nr:RNA polymerase II transcription factor B subunit 1 [Coemansia sp. RSA 2167]KAJ2143660.1 RNA polymerase II transcription factor B subunit 1 [Coemansia sp. RSA 564]KAJ2149023.1 RNA polymerase II transcription factor B subunit 1 [Coemansia sp. RSA 637]KAJ2258044.1 RNA polymerase II transcription factor B subunit 1 [Coemansia sp. RSA 454]KAJ2535453.1 RNA polymerase II transcription factor B subunit 1 [Coemansia sp. RSA 1935]KAJ2572732.1 RNA polymerase II transcription factor B subunit 1 [Coeman